MKNKADLYKMKNGWDRERAEEKKNQEFLQYIMRLDREAEERDRNRTRHIQKIAR